MDMVKVVASLNCQKQYGDGKNKINWNNNMLLD